MLKEGLKVALDHFSWKAAAVVFLFGVVVMVYAVSVGAFTSVA